MLKNCIFTLVFYKYKLNFCGYDVNNKERRKGGSCELKGYISKETC